jgi:hypothetical protein
LRTLYTILTILIFVSCSSNKNLTNEQVIGKYQRNGNYGLEYTIELKEDQTFEYNWQMGLISGTTFGTWKKEETKIIFNSERQPSEKGIEDYEIIMTEKKNYDSLSIKVVGPNNEPLHFATCALKVDTTTLIGTPTDIEGETKLPKLESADSLTISFIGYETIRHKLDSSISRYEFKMKEGSYYKYFTNETWTYKNGRLYNPSIKKNEYVKKNYYEKIK